MRGLRITEYFGEGAVKLDIHDIWLKIEKSPTRLYRKISDACSHKFLMVVPVIVVKPWTKVSFTGKFNYFFCYHVHFRTYIITQCYSFQYFLLVTFTVLRRHSILLLKYDILFDLLTFFSDGYWGNLHVIRYVLCSTHVGSNNFVNDALLVMADS